MLGQFLGLDKATVVGQVATAANSTAPPSTSLHASRSSSPRFGGTRRRNSSPKVRLEESIVADEVEVQLPASVAPPTLHAVEAMEASIVAAAAASKKRHLPAYAFAPKRPAAVDARQVQEIATSPWAHMNPV